MKPIQARARQIITLVLTLIPFQWFSPLRAHYQRSVTGTWSHRAMRTVLSIVRLRPIPAGTSFQLNDLPELSFYESNSAVTSYLYWFGTNGYEPSEAFWWRYLCRRNRKIVEFGSNIGYYTVLGASAAPEAHYIAVEPHPVTAKILRQNIELNSLQNVHVIEAAAVGERIADSTELFILARDRYQAPAGAIVKEMSEWTNLATKDSIDVPTIEARNLVVEADLLKFDIEGAEYQILSSVREYVDTARPTLVLEVYPGSAQLWALIRELCSVGAYSAVALTPTGPKLFDPATTDPQGLFERFSTHDLVLCDSVLAYELNGATASSAHVSVH